MPPHRTRHCRHLRALHPRCFCRGRPLRSLILPSRRSSARRRSRSVGCAKPSEAGSSGGWERCPSYCLLSGRAVLLDSVRACTTPLCVHLCHVTRLCTCVHIRVRLYASERECGLVFRLSKTEWSNAQRTHTHGATRHTRALQTTPGERDTVCACANVKPH